MLIIKLSCFSVCFCQDANCFCLFNGGILFANIEHLKIKSSKAEQQRPCCQTAALTERKSLKHLCFDFEFTEHLEIYLATFQVTKKYFSRYNSFLKYRTVRQMTTVQYRIHFHFEDSWKQF